MVKALKISGAIYAMGIVVFAVFFYLSGRAAPDDIAVPAGDPIQKTARSAAPDGESLLFPALDPDAVTTLSVYTPDSSFSFSSDGEGSVSVNGWQADGEIYRTLLEQIAELPVQTISPFLSDGAQLLLSLTVRTGDTTYTAYFYEDGETGESARIVSGAPDSPVYRQTDGWRIGQLMMTCEGTRIQDERGNETPCDF